MINSIKELYLEKIAAAEKLNHPRVLVNICSHGNEIIGLEVEKIFKDTEVINGSVTFNFANPWAVEQHKRFIEKDLNRSFPGSETGLFEERIANEMTKYISLFDYVFDIHSTESDLVNCIVIEDNNNVTQQMISVCHNAEKVLYVSATSGSSIFAACRLGEKIIPGLAFEYGDNSSESAKRTYEDLISILGDLNIIKNQLGNLELPKKIEQFECHKTFPKNPGDVLVESVKNYELVLKDSIVAYTADKKPILAPEDFYPILFGEPNYTDIFGFMAKK